MPKQLLNATFSASGSPSEVKEKFTEQVRTTAGDSPDQAQVVAAVRSFVEKSLEGASEDDSISAKASITITVNDVPKIVSAREAAMAEQHVGEIRRRDAEIATAKASLDEARKKIEELTTKPDTTDTTAEAKG